MRKTFGIQGAQSGVVKRLERVSDTKVSIGLNCNARKHGDIRCCIPPAIVAVFSVRFPIDCKYCND